MMKIYVKLIGGLGNQLFIYAYARMLQNYYSSDEVLLDFSAYSKYKIRDLEINNFRLNSKVKFECNYTGKRFFDCTSSLYRVCQVVYLRITHRYLDFPFKFLSKLGLFYSHMKANHFPKLNKTKIYVYGYFQYLPNFNEIRDVLIDELSINEYKYKKSSIYNEIYNIINEAEDPIAISVRCGEDYEKCGLNFCDAKYYINGLKRIVSESSSIFVFSDDIEKAKSIIHFDDCEVYFIPKIDPVGQLMLMKNCHKFVLSNSSFSWWGAYLSEYENKLVVFPSKWFTYKNARELNLLFSNYIIME